MLSKFDEVAAEDALDEVFGTEAQIDDSNLVTKLPPVGEIHQEGCNVFSGSVKCGKMSYFIHWSPAAYCATCQIHPDCYCTGPLMDMSEDLFIRWLGEAPRFRSGSDHMRTVPQGCYQRRTIHRS